MQSSNVAKSRQDRSLEGRTGATFGTYIVVKLIGTMEDRIG